jgi:hypothetical protein
MPPAATRAFFANLFEWGSCFIHAPLFKYLQGVINMHDILSLLVARCKIHVHHRESEAKQLCGGV